MGQQRSLKQLAKMFSYVLGRRPDEFGLVLDEDGYVKIKDFVKAIGEEEGWRYVRRAHIDEILYTLPDPPIELDNLHIRSKQRDKLPTANPADSPPKLLYHAIRRRAHPNVDRKGIFPGAHPQIILSSDTAMAERMGRRIDPSPILLTILVQDCLARGVRFLQAGESLYLAEFIPPGCFTGPPLPKEKPEAARPAGKKEPTIAPPSPGTFVMNLNGDKKKRERSKRKKKKELSRERDRDRKRKRREKIW